MKEYAFRLKHGDDIKRSIENYCLENGINTGIILSAVGCIYHAKIRLAKAIDILDVEDDFEVLSLNGTISSGRSHLHIALSNDKGEVLGGHLLEGSVVNTTLEVVIGSLEEYRSKRCFDDSTGYNEIVFERIRNESDY